MDIEQAKRDSEHLHWCIEYFEKIKQKTFEDEKVPFLQKARDLVYLDGVLAVLTTRKP